MDKIENYISKKEVWQEELKLLRSVLKKLPLVETIKWGAPTYVYQGKNVAGIAAFKNYFGLWFFQGSLLKDEQKVLMNAQEHKTKAMLQWRFYHKGEINESLITKYVLEAIDNIKKGKEIKPIRNSKPLKLPIELQDSLASDKSLREHFNQFSISKQREFADYISEAKRDQTKQNRLEKIKPMILKNMGLNDQYRRN